LIQDGGKFGVRSGFLPVVTNIRNLVLGATQMSPPDFQAMPRGYQTARVQRALQELADQLDELAVLADPIAHAITAEPTPLLTVLSVNPGSGRQGTSTVSVRGTGFEVGATSDFGLALGSAV